MRIFLSSNYIIFFLKNVYIKAYLSTLCWNIESSHWRSTTRNL